MKVSDYIVSFLINRGITDVFGYPGGMITPLMDSFTKQSDKISAHLNYHEQASAFCACGYGQVKGEPGVAYTTSGPGATNLITGIANAYYDSIPSLFITGQVNTYESKGNLTVRQKGFQETDIVSIVKSITKYAYQINNACNIRYQLEKAYNLSLEGRPGPVLLDIPFNILREEIKPESLPPYTKIDSTGTDACIDEVLNTLYNAINSAQKPLILAGAGIRSAGMKNIFHALINNLKIPVVTSMIAVDCLPDESQYKFGFIGAYGHRYANILQAKCDLLISLGSRLDTRQTGVQKERFSENARLIRIDVSEEELRNNIKDAEISIKYNLKELLPRMLTDKRFAFNKHVDWLTKCKTIKQELNGMDRLLPNEFVREISNYVPKNAIITTDVGQNQVWIAQDFQIQEGQTILFSGGHGAMGYSLPAAIGAYYAERHPVISFNGDGGLQMNIQELQFIAREKLPIKIIVLNNNSLGMIRHFQEMYFDCVYTQTTADYGYTIPDFCKLAEAYGIASINITKLESVQTLDKLINNNEPVLINIECGNQTYVYPKLGMGKPTYDQEPLLEREYLSKIMHNME